VTWPGPAGAGAPPRRYERLERVDVLAGRDLGRLRRATVVVIGCGALGSAVSALLVRTGVGLVRVVDRDIVERRNLADQALFTEADARARAPKAEAAAAYLNQLNADSRCEGVVADFGPGNARELLDDADIVVDGVDNVEAKFLLNDVAVATRTPLAYGGCAGTEGVVMVVRPGASHCLRCLWPRPETMATPGCRTRGVLPSTIALTAGFQYGEVLKVLVGAERDLVGGLIRICAWDGVIRKVPMPPFPSEASPCPACDRGEFPYLDGARTTRATRLCGDDTVLLASANGSSDLDGLARRRRDDPTLRVHPMCIEFEVDGCRVLVFSSGKTLVHGAGDEARARSIHAEHVAG
jgi:adenylyltransferase/sulfurtransferase